MKPQMNKGMLMKKVPEKSMAKAMPPAHKPHTPKQMDQMMRGMKK